MPQIPKDQQTKMTNATTAIDDIFTRSIIGGSKFTVEQAAAEAAKEWERGSGPEIQAWYTEWWNKEKDNVLIWEDFYEIYQQQQADFAKLQ